MKTTNLKYLIVIESETVSILHVWAGEYRILARPYSSVQECLKKYTKMNQVYLQLKEAK